MCTSRISTSFAFREGRMYYNSVGVVFSILVGCYIIRNLLIFSLESARVITWMD